MDGVKRAARDWAANGKTAAWLTHVTGRLEAAERLRERPDLAANLGPTDREYLAACQKAEAAAKARKRRGQAAVYGMLVGIITGLVGWINQAYIKEQVNWFVTMRPYMMANVRPYVLAAEAERGAAAAGDVPRMRERLPRDDRRARRRVHDGIARERSEPL